MLSEASIPTQIKRITEGDAGAGLEISWSTGELTTISSRALRTNCPCASCNERRGDPSHQKPLTGGRNSLRVLKNTLEEEINLVKIWAVGNYAVGARWGDNHDSGIFSYKMLRELARPSAPSDSAA